MRISVLPQKLHGGNIRSVDINASHTWMATGGSDNLISFWDLAKFADINAANAEMLAQLAPENTMDIHKAPVSVLRWCPTMDHIIMSADTAGRVAVSNSRDSSHKQIFPWPNAQEAYTGAVIDALWSRDGRLLAWVTADGCVHLYDIERHTHQFLVDAVAKNQKPNVQRGIAFDPTSNLLATFGDDSCITVYQYQFDNNGNYQFKVQQVISKLASNGATNAPTQGCWRFSWSCDGEFLAFPSASKQLPSLIALMSRSQGWNNKVNLVGQDMGCNIVSFAPRIFDSRQTPPPVIKVETGMEEVDEDMKIDAYHIIASVGTDKGLVIWNTSKETPIVVIKDITSEPIADLAWNLATNSLFLVSGDGHIVVATFAEEELGFVAPEEFLDKLKASQSHAIKQFAVKSEDSSIKSKASKSVSEVIDQKHASNLLVEFSKKAVPQDLEPAEKTPADATRSPTSDASTTMLGDYTPVVLSADTTEFQDASDDLLNILEARITDSAVATSLPPPKTKTEPKSESKAAKKLTLDTQKITKKDGKKRVQPTLLSNGNNTRSVPDEKSITLPLNNVSNSGPRDLMEFDKPSYTVLDVFQKDLKRSKAPESTSALKKAKRVPEPVKFIGSVVVNPNTSFSKLRLSTPRIRVTFRLNSRASELTFLDIRNGEGNEHTPSRVTQFTNETQVWTDFIPKYIQLAVEGESFWAICTADGQLYVYSHLSGARVLPPIILGSPLSFLESHGRYLMAITSVGEMYVWDMDLKKIHLHSPLTIAALLDLNSKYQEDGLSRTDSVSMCSITAKGIPLVTLTNGSGYLFNIDLNVWQTVSETWWAFGSHYWDSITDDKSAQPTGLAEGENSRESSIIGLLEHKTNEEIVRKSRLGRGKFFNKISKNMIMKEGFENLENIISISHMENRILCSELLGEKADFKDFVVTYAKRLSELGLKAKLFELCQDLLADEQVDAEKAEVCGLNKHELLKEIVVDCAEHRDSQRILAYFGQKLGVISAEY